MGHYGKKGLPGLDGGDFGGIPGFLMALNLGAPAFDARRCSA
jgi:hypothetical protein